MYLYDTSGTLLAMRAALAVWLLFLATFAFGQEDFILPGDKVVVNVAGLKDYNTETVVMVDGTISGIGFRRVKVGGLSLEDARKRVEIALRKTLKDPAVSLYVKDAAPRNVFVAGIEVAAKPIEWTAGMTLRQLIATVRLPADADLLDANLTRSGQTGSTAINLRALLQADPSQPDLKLFPGDTLAILPRAYVRVWVTGFVTKPGQLRVDRDANAYQALASAGGVLRNPLGPSGTSITTDELELTLRRGSTVLPIPIRPAAGEEVTLQEGDVLNVEAPGLVRIYVSGEVIKTGEIILRTGTSVGAAVSASGGLKDTGTLVDVTVIRGPEMYQVDASSAQTGVKPTDFALQTGDVVYVRRNERYLWVLGEVMQPGRYPFLDGEELTASDALSKAKGLRPTGSNRRAVLVSPDGKGKYTAKQFNIDEWLKDGKMAANPKVKPGDYLFFTTPKGFTTANLAQALSSALIIQNIFRR